MTSGLWRKHQLQLRLYSELDKKLKVSSINWFFIFRVFQKTKQTKKQKPPTNQPNKKKTQNQQNKKIEKKIGIVIIWSLNYHDHFINT